MKLGKIIITTENKLNELIKSEVEKAKLNFMENEFPKMQDEIWNDAIEHYKTTPQGSAVMSRKELEEENQELKATVDEFRELLWAKQLFLKFIKGE